MAIQCSIIKKWAHDDWSIGIVKLLTSCAASCARHWSLHDYDWDSWVVTGWDFITLKLLNPLPKLRQKKDSAHSRDRSEPPRIRVPFFLRSSGDLKGWSSQDVFVDLGHPCSKKGFLWGWKTITIWRFPEIRGTPQSSIYKNDFPL